MRTAGVVAIGGALGTAARYGLGQQFPTGPGAFPTTTLVENVLGAALLGCLLTALGTRTRNSRWLLPLAATGVLGSFTTFSTFASETVLLARDGQLGVAGAYVAATIALGITAAAAGIAATRGWMRARGVPR